jgi:hypothetical protein
VKSFESQYGIAVRMSCHFAPSTEIPIKTAQRCADDDWWSATNGQIEKALQCYIKPRDDVGFKTLLRESVSFQINNAFKDNDPDPSNFECIYQAANLYQYWFAKVYNFLATAPRINPKAIPRMSARGDGIIATFISKLPPTFADNIRSSSTIISEARLPAQRTMRTSVIL